MDANPQQQTSGQPAPRPPQLEGQMFAMLTELDGFLARTPLTRAEQGQANNLVQTLVRRLEADEQEKKRLQERCNSMDAELAKLRNKVQSSMVDEVLAEPFNTK